MKQYTYQVAGHGFSIQLCDVTFPTTQLLKQYEPFQNDSLYTPLFHLQVKKVPALPIPSQTYLLKHFAEDDPSFWIYKEKESYSFGFAPAVSSTPQCLIVHHPAQNKHILYLSENTDFTTILFGLNNALMLLYMIYTAPLDTLLIHSSVIRKGQYGYAFLGKSGTGKSTHSRLWLCHIPDTELLNDDNPVVRAYPDKVVIYGSPWSGKTPCYRNEEAELKGIVRLSQAPQNTIRTLAGIEAYAALLPSCSSTRWDKETAEGIHRTLEKVIRLCKVCHLKCLPDREAALLCHKTLNNP